MARKAFLIGIDTMGLNCCRNDADLMRECLEKRGYEVITLNNKQEKWAILPKFEEFLHKSNKVDTIIFYFSGHGVIPGGKLSLITDEDNSQTKNKIQINNITDPLQNCIAENKLIILDCCHAGRVNAEWRPDPSDAYRILIASNPLEPAKELDDLHASFLTHRICQALNSPLPEIVDDNGIIRINALSRWIQKEAKKYNSIEKSKGVAIPYLIGNDKYDFEIAAVTSEELKKFKLPDKGSSLLDNCTMIQSPGNHSIQIEEKYMDQLTSIKDFDASALNRFRNQLRDDTREHYPDNLSHEDFLTNANLLVNGYLTRTGVLLFGKNPIDACRSAVTQCYKYYGTNKTARRDRKQLSLTITDQITAGRDFVALNIKKVETPVADRAKSQVEYEYPMICVREIIANALAHRDYEDSNRFVHITLFADRIEISSPGNWFGKPLIDDKSYDLDELKSSSIKRNIALADVLSWILLVEGEGSGIPTAIEECKEKDAPIPNVIQKDGFIIVTIWPVRNFQKSLESSNYASPIVPHQIPPPPRYFKGREDEIGDILSNFEKGATITGIRGMGGIGKTALALVLADKIKNKFPDGQIFIEMRGTSTNPALPPLTPDEAMSHAIRAFSPADKLPENSNELGGLYHSILAGKRVLLLLDNAASAEQVEPLLPPEGCSVLITSRIKFALPGLAEKDLDILPPDKACELLLDIAPRIGGGADKLAKLCGYLPLALRNAAKTLAERKNLGVSEYELRLRNKMERLELVKASFSISYDLMSPGRKRQWRSLSVFPADFDRSAAAAVLKMAPGPSAESLSDLVRLSLVDYVQIPDAKDGRYKLHDLVRLFAESCLEPSEVVDAQQKHAKHFLKVLSKADKLYRKGGNSILAGLELFDREWANIKVGHAWTKNKIQGHRKLIKIDSKIALEMANSYANDGIYILDLRLHPRYQIDWLETGLIAARIMGDRCAEGNHLGNLGRAYYSLGEIRKAIEYYEQALAIACEIGDKRNEGVWLDNLGRAYADLSETRKAIKYHEQALAIAREIGNKRGEGVDLGNLGNAYAALGETLKAVEYYDQALAIAQEIGDKRIEGTVLGNQGNLGLAYAAFGEKSKNIEYYDKALAIAREIGDRRNEGAWLGNLGRAYAALGETRKAIEYYEQALKIAQEIGNRQNEGEILKNLGKAYADTGDSNKSIDYCDQALEIFKKMEYRRGEGEALFCKSLALYELGQRQEALDAAKGALHIFGQIESPHAEKVRQKLALWQASGPQEN
jgi:tetratricopeptide (TPR) repeat protein